MMSKPRHWESARSRPITGSRGFAFPWALAALLGCLASSPRIVAQSLPLSGSGIDAGGHFQVTFPGDPSSYFLLRRGRTLGGPSFPVALGLGPSGPQQLRDPEGAGPGSAFFSIERRPRSAPLDSDGDGLDDVYELSHPAILSPLDPSDAAGDPDADGATNLEEYDHGTDPQEANVPVTRVSFSPSDGEGGVSVERETIVRFTHPLATGTVLTSDILHAEFAGRRLLGRLELGTDRTMATLFHQEPLPGGARLRVTLDGNALLDERGVAVDADADGLPGGVGIADFETTSTTPVAGTVLRGRVFASEVVAGTGANRPLEGVTITVDGHEETLRATTDAEGRFTLDPSPAGEFFVHVDGRTSPLSRWPGGAYYPFVGKRWTAVAGRQDNLAPGNGEIYLPRIDADALQPVSATQPVVIRPSSAVLAANPQLAGLELTVPPNALFDARGGRGGRVGIAPVPPDRLPEPLPEGLKFPLVITVQTDGPQNFDQPVPVRFPNLPDPLTGAPLAPGAKSALWSFNHDTGTWEIAGPMTVTADGRFVETDPGVGILQPGWHGWFSGSRLKRKKEKCETLGLSDAWDIAKTGYDCVKNLTRGLRVVGAIFDVADNVRKVGDGLIQLRKDYRDGVIDAETLKTGIETLSAYKNGAKAAYEELFAQNPLSKAIEAAKCASSLARVGLDKLCKNKDRTCTGRVVRNVCNTLQPAITAGDILIQNIKEMEKSLRKAPLLAVCSAFDQLGATLGATVSSGPVLARLRVQTEPDPEILALLDFTIWETQRFQAEIAPFVDTYNSLSSVEAWMTATIRTGFGVVVANSGGLAQLPYALELNGEIVQRGHLSAQGDVTLNVRPGAAYRLLAYDPARAALFISQGVTAPAGTSGELADFQIEFLEGQSDRDGDGLVDVAEEVLGTDPGAADTDGDGVTDLAEVLQGLDPLGGRPAETGILGTAATPGNAVDVAAANGAVVTANESGGISVFSAAGGRNPVQIAQVAIPGRALRVAWLDSRVAVAAQAAGLVLVDVSDPPAARILRQINVGGVAEAVATRGDLVCVGTRNGDLVLVDGADGTVLSRLHLRESIRDVGFARDALYALGDTRLFAVDFDAATLLLRGSVDSPTPTGFHQRLTLGDTVAYAVHPRGFNTFDLQQPFQPRLVTAGVTPQVGWKQIVPNGSGLGIAAVGLNLGLTGPHNISLYNLANPADNGAFITELVTPGIARAVTLYGGLGYVADGPAGLEVINYLPYDRLGKPPTIRIETSQPNGDVETGQQVRVTAQVADDVQVAQVSFRINGRTVFTDGGFPFEFVFNAGPPWLANADPFQLDAIAVDTGGNTATSASLTLRTVPDARPPRIRRVAPFDGELLGAVPGVTVFFSEPLDPVTVHDTSFQVLAPGPDQLPGTADDVPIPGRREFQTGLNLVRFLPDSPLGPGDYRILVSPPLADLAGNILAATFESRFRIYAIQDEDGDGMPDELESLLGLDPTRADTDADGVPDGEEDFDRDGLPNAGELAAGTDPRNADTDDNGVRDGAEDPDGDALTNAAEFAAGADPRQADTDRDGWNDEAEVTAGSDPRNPASRPALWIGARPSTDVTLPSRTAIPGLGTVVANPGVDVTLLSTAADSGFLASGSLVARPGISVVLPVAVPPPSADSAGVFIARPPLDLKINAP
ncbi:MAG: hypothetical protein JNL10_22290 [Verrucomicrobiales bacterium]|nr:hypothetical protein [Verrucomicrobiales bacterium]